MLYMRLGIALEAQMSTFMFKNMASYALVCFITGRPGTLSLEGGWREHSMRLRHL